MRLPSRIPFRILFFLLLFSFTLSSCVETLIRITLRPQGGGAMELHYGIHREFMERFLVVEKNALLPITASEIAPWVKRFPGVSLLNYQIEDRADPRHKGIRVVHLYLIFDNLEAFRLNHVWFAYYPYKGEQIFQFFIHKQNPEEATASTILIDTITNPFKIRLEVEFPAKILSSNATELGWSRAVWEIPLRAVFSGPQTDIVAWARTPRFPSQWMAGWINPVRFWVLGEEWRSPKHLPEILVEPLPPLPQAPENPPLSTQP